MSLPLTDKQEEAMPNAWKGEILSKLKEKSSK
jgi:hypothetical protein